jgi:hypothetical protein
MLSKNMECLHGKPASSSKTTNGVFFYCGQKPSCNFFCSQNDCSYFENAIAMWRNSNSPQPRCHEHKKLAKMLVVKDIFKPSFGRPFFVCPDKEKPCSFWQWGDVIRPQCYHGVQCSTRKVKKEGANQGRLFYVCSKGKDESCGYFEWRDIREDEDPLEPFSIVYFSNPPSYEYTIKDTGEKFTSCHENRKQAYEEYLSIKDKKDL